MMRNVVPVPCWLIVTLCYMLSTVASNPVIIQHPQSRYVIKNDTSVTLDCSVQGEPRPQITWYKDRMMLSADTSGDSVLLKTGQLLLRNSYVSSNRGQRSNIIGDYYCNATNPLTGFSVVSRTARLEAAEKPVVTQGPKDIAVMENSDVLFHCSATGYPKPVIVWKKLDGQIPAERSEIRSDNSLKIKSVQSSDEGQYVCRVDNALGSMQVNAKLTVFTQPTFVVVPTDKMALVGQRLKIRCVATGNPLPTVHWNKLSAQTLLFPNEYSERIHVSNDGTLNIHSVQPRDVGEYSCQALSSAGSSFVNIRIGVTESELRPPPIIYQGSQNQTLPVGGVASLPCLASGEPAPTIYWFKGTNVVTSSQARVSILNSGTLEISDLTQQDTGVYTCVAVSETGESTWTCALIVEQSSSSVVFHQTPESSTFPGAPSKPFVTNVTETAIWLSWRPSDNNGASAVVSYSVEYFNQKNCQCWIMLSDSISQPYYVANNLSPNTTYVFLVRAQNSHGISLPSPVTASVRTKAGVSLISSSIVSFSLDALNSVSIHLDPPLVLNSSTVRLKWKVSATRGYRQFDGYHIMYRRVLRDAFTLSDDGGVDEDGNTMARQMEADYSVLTVRSSMETSFVLTGLQHSSSYEIFVQPFNGVSLGATSNMVRVLMAEETDGGGMTSSSWTDQAWIVATLVSLIGGLFVVGLCVCTVCVVRQRHRCNKQPITRDPAKQSRNGDPQPVSRTRYDPHCLDPLLTVDGAIYSAVGSKNNGRRCQGNKSQTVRCCYDNNSAASNELKQTNIKVHLPEAMSNGAALPRVRTPSTNNSASRSTPSVSPAQLYPSTSVPNPEAYMIQRMSQDDYDMIGRNESLSEQWQNYDWL